MRVFIAMVVFLSVWIVSVGAIDSKYMLSNMGESCTAACLRSGMNCNPAINTGNSTAAFKALGVACTADPQPWWAENQPCFVAGKTDPNYGKCLGWSDHPAAVLCSGSYDTVQRLCRCDAPSSSLKTFGTVESSASIGPAEKEVFSWVLSGEQTGAMTHFWITYSSATDPSTMIRYYVDGETTASIAFTPSMAAGTGFYDPTAPWGTEYFGKGAKDGSWFWNFRVPFNRTIRITAQHTDGDAGYYIIVRGGTDLPLNLGGVMVPPTAKLVQTVTSGTFQPLQWVPLATIPRGKSGVHFMETLSFVSPNLNVLEGCLHQYTAGQEFPGTVLSSGTEDFFDSGWYFSAGQFRLPVSGLTHLEKGNDNNMYSSMYRFHNTDPLQFADGFELVWRIGDTVDAAGRKCFTNSTTAKRVGSPQPTNVTAYAWTYVW